MAKTIKLIVSTGKAQTTQTFDVTPGGVHGQPMRIQAVNGARYQLQDPAASNTAPQNLRTKRLGKNLHISLEGSTESDLIIEGYYEAPPEMGGQGSVYGRAEDGKLYEYSPQDAGASPAPMALKDGAPAVSQTLGGVEMEGYELSNLPVSGGGFGGFVTSLIGVAAVANSREKMDDKVAVAVNKIEAYNNGDGTTPAALTLQDYVDAGVTGVTANNLAIVNAKVLAASTGGADTTAEVQALVAAAVGAYDASLNLIATYAETGVTAPTLSDYTQVGVAGVTTGNLAAINSAINAQAGADSVVGNANDRDGADTAAEVQNIVSAYNAILSAADGVDNTANSANPTQVQYASIGVTGVSTAAHASLLGDIIDGLATTAVDTVAKVQALADAVAAVLTGAANGNAPTLAQLLSLGLSNVNANNIALVQAAIAGTANDGSDVDTWAELQALIRSVNIPAIIGGDTTKALTEANAALSTGGTLTITDADGSPTFTAQNNIAGSNGYGAFSINTAGAWTYAMNGAHDAFVSGQNYTDSITVAAADGTQQVVTVTITGTNDAAIISGTSTAALTETNAAQTATGTLTSRDVDGTANLFTAQTSVAGSNGYGAFSITTGGTWTYTMNSAHDAFVGGTAYTDSITVAAADGTQQVLTVTITGSNDAAVISGASTAALTETNTAQTATGTLTSSDVDGTANLFIAQANITGSNGYGTFSIDTAGAWTYTMNGAHDAFVSGQNYTDSITVAAADGTQQVVAVTISGTNDAAIISGTSTAALTETNAAQTATGTLTSTDVDGTANLFIAQTNITGSNGYGAFSINTAGAWTYTMNGAHDAFVSGQNYTDSITVAAADGTQQVVTVTITGTNDAPTNTVPNTQTAVEDAQVSIIGISTTDGDGNLAFTQLTVLHGALNVSIAGGATISAGANDSATLTLSGTQAQINTALATIKYTGVLNYNGADTLTVSSNDSAGTPLTDSDDVAITVTAVNDAPVLTNGSTLAYTENAAAATINTTITVSDVDSMTLASAIVKISGGYVSGQDVLSFTNMAGTMGDIAGVLSGDTMTLTSASGTATRSEWEVALRAVSYSNSSENPTTAARTVSYEISDGTSTSTALTSTINVTAVNDQPVSAGYANIYPNLEDQGAPVNGTAVGMTIGSFSSAYFPGKDPEGVTVGLAIAGPIPSDKGTVWYSLNDGATWLNLTTATATASMTNAFLLNSTARVYVQGNANVQNGVGIVYISRLWDGTDGAVSGTFKDISGLTGPTGAYSATDTKLYFGVNAVNDVPSLTATAAGGTYSGSAAVAAFSASDVNAGPLEASQKFIKLVFTVSGLADGASEQLTVDGSTFSLTHGTTGATTTNGVTYTVSLTGTTATVTLDKAAGVAATAFNALVNSIAYSDVASVRTSGNRVIRLTTLQDSGGVANGGIDTATLNLASTINVQATVPVVLDLNRDGTFSYSQVVMDVNGDGLLDKTAWAGAQDGVLVWDKYADAKVHDASQYAFAQYGGRTDLQGLAAGFDTNLDGKFNAQDAKFAQFKIWQDLNQNGISDAGEVRSLADWGIAEINLSSDGVVRTPAAGVAEAGRTTATTTDGSSLLVADASFDSTPLDYSVTLASTAQTGAKLSVLGSGMSFDLSRFIAQHGAIAEVDLSGTGSNTLTLNLNDVLQGASANILKVTGDADDVLNVQLATDWTNTGLVVASNDHNYVVFSANANSAAQLLIDQHLLIQAA